MPATGSRGAAVAEVLKTTRANILAELCEVLEQAKEDGKLGLANGALELLARLRGGMINRSAVRTVELRVLANGVHVQDLA